MAAVSCQLLEARQYLLMCDLNVKEAVEVFHSAIPSANQPRRQVLTRRRSCLVCRSGTWETMPVVLCSASPPAITFPSARGPPSCVAIMAMNRRPRNILKHPETPRNHH
jgi:hypothetical protein